MSSTPSPATAPQWWLASQGAPTGPHSEAFVLAGLKAGVISPQVKACPDGDQEWRRLCDWPAFAANCAGELQPEATVVPVAPPMPSTRQSSWQWKCFVVTMGMHIFLIGAGVLGVISLKWTAFTMGALIILFFAAFSRISAWKRIVATMCVLLGIVAVFVIGVQQYSASLRVAGHTFLQNGKSVAEKGQFDNAIKWFTFAIDFDPKCAEAYWRRGNAYGEKGDIFGAIADYNEAIRIAPQFTEAYVNRGVAYEEKGEHDRAITDFTRAIRLDPEHGLAYYDRAIAYEKIGEKAKAEEDHKRAKELGYKSK